MKFKQWRRSSRKDLASLCKILHCSKFNINLFNARFTQLLSQAAEHGAEMSNVLATNRQRTLNATLKLYSGYSEEEHEMLQKRVFKQIELDSAKKNFEKAKPPKKQQVRNRNSYGKH